MLFLHLVLKGLLSAFCSPEEALHVDDRLLARPRDAGLLAPLRRGNHCESDADTALDGYDALERRNTHVRVLLAREAAPREALDVFGGLVQLQDFPPFDHAHNVPLDGHRGRVPLQHAPHQKTSGVALDGLSILVHAHAAHVVRPPNRLNHRCADPCDRHPLGVLLAVPMPGTPHRLDALGGELLQRGGRVRASALSDLPPLGQVDGDLVTVRRGIEDASASDKPRRARGPMHGPVWPVVCRTRTEADLGALTALDDVHQGVGVVVQGLHERLFLEDRAFADLRETELAHVVGLRHWLSELL
mmetsp:Transcript_41442/g.114190  ORF Transcript_41442/g.114190 Transcript_41442/m.114190 type:complete len:302 (-) Transcript_41442:1156-2061(-)